MQLTEILRQKVSKPSRGRQQQQHPAKIQLISYSKQQAARQFLKDKPSKDQRCNQNNNNKGHSKRRAQ
jgi:hypothetical protein